MNLRSLELLVAVVECGGVTSASNRLFISQPSVSQAIADVEREYGVMLFERLNKQLILTQIGRDVYIKSKAIINSYKELEGALVDNFQRRSLRIGGSVTVGNCILSRVMESFALNRSLNYDKVVIDNTEYICTQILTGELDIAIVEGSVDDKKFKIIELCDDELGIIARYDYLMVDNKIDNFVLREEGSGTRELAIECLKGNMVTCHNIWQMSSTQAILEFLMSGRCASGMSLRIVNEYIKAGKLKLLFGETKKRKFYIIYHKDKVVNEIMKEFMDYAVSDECKELL